MPNLFWQLSGDRSGDDMRMHNRSYDLEALEEQIEALLDASGRGAAVIVEGPRDRDALRRIGLSGPILMSSQRSCLELAEETARSYSEIILMTDWDARGEEIAHKMEEYLRPTGVRVDAEIRKRLKILVRKEIKDVESLWIFLERARESQGL